MKIVQKYTIKKQLLHKNTSTHLKEAIYDLLVITFIIIIIIICYFAHKTQVQTKHMNTDSALIKIRNRKLICRMKYWYLALCQLAFLVIPFCVFAYR